MQSLILFTDRFQSFTFFVYTSIRFNIKACATIFLVICILACSVFLHFLLGSFADRFSEPSSSFFESIIRFPVSPAWEFYINCRIRIMRNLARRIAKSEKSIDIRNKEENKESLGKFKVLKRFIKISSEIILMKGKVEFKAELFGFQN